MNDAVFASHEMLLDFVSQVFIALGSPRDEARIIADVILAADIRGIDSHGIGRLKPIYYNRIKAGIQFAKSNIQTLRQGPCTALLDGNHGMGQVIALRAMEMAISKARQMGMGMVAVKNSTHYGMAGYYPLMAAQENMIGITGTNARPSIAPTFSVENMLGTNPLSFAFPTDEAFPFMLDCATSVSQRGRIELLARKGEPMPHGWVVGSQGESLCSATEVLELLSRDEAALAPLGGLGEDNAGYKGYGFACVVETLSAALQSGPFLKALAAVDRGEDSHHRLGHFFIAIDIEAFLPAEEFKKTAGDIMRGLRAAKKAPQAKRIFTAGEKEYLMMEDRKITGIPVISSVRKELSQINKELNLGFSLPWAD